MMACRFPLSSLLVTRLGFIFEAGPAGGWKDLRAHNDATHDGSSCLSASHFGVETFLWPGAG
jgi:hypothetical protein